MRIEEKMKKKNTEEGYREIWARQRKTGRARCKSECVNMLRSNLIILPPPGSVIRCLIKARDGGKEVEERGGGMREG